MGLGLQVYWDNCLLLAQQAAFSFKAAHGFLNSYMCIESKIQLLSSELQKGAPGAPPLPPPSPPPPPAGGPAYTPVPPILPSLTAQLATPGAIALTATSTTLPAA